MLSNKSLDLSLCLGCGTCKDGGIDDSSVTESKLLLTKQSIVHGKILGRGVT